MTRLNPNAGDLTIVDRSRSKTAGHGPDDDGRTKRTLVPNAPVSSSGLFHSFWLGGFEAAHHINGRGARVDMIAATQHDRRAVEDYARLRSVGIRTVREGVQWHLVDRGGDYDFASLAPIAQAARTGGMQVIWTLCHYGWPDDLDLFSPAFIDRFRRYCRAVARFLGERQEEAPFYSPINEISFFAFACGEVGWFHPFAQGRGDELKRQLVRAAIAGAEAIWEVDPRARIVHVDPIVQMVAPRDRPELLVEAAAATRSQFDAWDMLAGRSHPELGGHPRYLDNVGANFYYNGQWELEGERLRWEDVPRDDRWTPLSGLLAAVHHRYGRPLFLAETGHFGVGRARWLTEAAAEVRRALALGVPVEGVCLYPIIDRPDWHDPEVWHRSGLWDLVPDDTGRLLRVLIADYAAALQRAAMPALSLTKCRGSASARRFQGIAGQPSCGRRRRRSRMSAANVGSGWKSRAI